MTPPTHEAISHRAHQLWLEHGRPAGQDDAIWLSAERQLTAKAAAHDAAQTVHEPSGAAFAERAKAETAAESVVEYHITPALPDAEAIQAALQNQAARAPQVPHHTGPRAKPVESGKPLWNQPHSS